MIERFWALGARGLWMLLVVLLPITSLPLLVRLVGSETVAAPSGLALLAFSVLWLIPQLVKGIALPRPVVPIFGLFFVAALSSILSLWLPLPAYKGIPAVQNTLSAVLTLAVGVCFYLAASTYPSSDERLSWTFRLLNWSGLVVILWSFAQMVGWHAARYPMWMREIHALYSVGPLFRDRVTGFALEPSWLANQLNLMYLPFWLSASVRRFSVHKMLPGDISLENILLAGGFTVLLLTLSRVGMLAFLLMAGYLLLRLNQLAVRRVHQIALNRWNNPAFHQALKKGLVYVGIVLLLFAFYAAVISGAGYGLSKIDPRMKEFFTFSWEDSNPLLK
ncbi:MAG: hypothetical protein U1B80_02970, partial [Anaerolineaceae bacterium]|nr:hypothetical protein [Anaerolineaceae bacterium]